MKVVFLDRDGVINHDSPDYIKSWSEFSFIPGSIDAIKRLTKHRFDIFIITNQSIINRNMASGDALETIFLNMKNVIRSAGGDIKDIFYCPHTPDDCCDCRKPKPGLIYRAKEKYGIDLSTTYMVGDNVKDVECGQNAGCGFTVLVKTGSGRESEKLLAQKKKMPSFVADNLSEAADWIIGHYYKTNLSRNEHL